MALRFDTYIGALVFILLSAVFDFLDGMSARLLNSCSKTGKELDSLADVISFGLAPGCIIFIYLEHLSNTIGILSVAFFAFLLPAFSALRLAKFNVDVRQTTAFLGLPVPASSLFWASFIPTLHYYVVLPSVWLLIIVILFLFISCWLMISEIPMFSLKFKQLKWAGNEWSISLIVIFLLLAGIFVFLGMPPVAICITIVAYIAMSLIKNILK
jgi:CDP-diacylglycerol--serine O-phosphatidyltransferase